MRKVIDVSTDEKESSKPVEFTHFKNELDGWSSITRTPKEFKKVVYLGHDETDGCLFAAYEEGNIYIYKGHLNSGTY
jgi:hypothetical protein